MLQSNRRRHESGTAIAQRGSRRSGCFQSHRRSGDWRFQRRQGNQEVRRGTRRFERVVSEPELKLVFPVPLSEPVIYGEMKMSNEIDLASAVATELVKQVPIKEVYKDGLSP